MDPIGRYSLLRYFCYNVSRPAARPATYYNFLDVHLIKSGTKSCLQTTTKRLTESDVRANVDTPLCFALMRSAMSACPRHGRLQEIFLGGVDINSFRFLQVLHELIYGRYFITQHGLHFVQRIELAPESRNFSTSTLSIIPQEKCIRLKPSYLV